MKLFLAGHNGMVGRSIHKILKDEFEYEIITESRSNLDLTNQKEVKDFLTIKKPDAVIIAAAKVGGIHANNTYPANFIYENIMIQNNLIHESYVSGIKKILFLGSSCIYPKDAQQPMKESYLLTGKLEETNEPYAIAKIAGIKTCESYNRQYGVDYRSIMPTNLYGPYDNFHPMNSHVVPALIRRFHEAKINNDKEILIWGDGSPLREFLHVDDMARASIFILGLSKTDYKNKVDDMLSHINIGSGEEISIKNLAYLVAKTVGYDGQIKFDTTKPNGTKRKLLDTYKINSMGWKPLIKLEQGLLDTYKWYLANISS
jgi:nucleoside-diphosphate-sugar epimerase